MDGNHKLPKEILLDIFMYYLETESQFDLIYNVSHVCRLWKHTCMDKSLWRTFDGTLPLPFLKLLSKEGSLNDTQHFKFSHSKTSLSNKEVRFIYKNLPSLKSINFSNVSWMFSSHPDKFLQLLSCHCPKLCEIIFMEKLMKIRPRIALQSLDDCFRKRGNTFISLDLSNTTMVGEQYIFNTIGCYCPKLEELKVRNVLNLSGSYFPIVHMQKCLKKLKVLELGKRIPVRVETSEPNQGFPNLETFVYRSVKDLNKLWFRKLLMKSPELKVLDIAGCNLESPLTIRQLPAKNLEKLHVSNTDVYENREFFHVLKKWSHSLVELDVSNMKKNSIDTLLNSILLLHDLRNLETLRLRNTAVTIGTVIYIIHRCSKLKLLDLTGCEAVFEGDIGVYNGQAEIQELLRVLTDEIRDEN